MKQNAQTLVKEHEILRSRVKELIRQLYRQNSQSARHGAASELFLLEEWEYEGQVFNAITEQGLAHIMGERVNELFTWDDLEVESLIEIVHILEDKEFVVDVALS